VEGGRGGRSGRNDRCGLWGQQQEVPGQFRYDELHDPGDDHVGGWRADGDHCPAGFEWCFTGGDAGYDRTGDDGEEVFEHKCDDAEGRDERHQWHQQRSTYAYDGGTSEHPAWRDDHLRKDRGHRKPRPREDTNQAPSDGVIADSLYDMLFYNDVATGTIAPQTAESITSTDAITWTLKLRPNIKFSDGTAYDASAVKFNYLRLQDPANVAVRATQANLIATMTVTDPQTLGFTLKAKNALFPGALTLIPFVASPAAVQAQGGRYGSDANNGGLDIMFNTKTKPFNDIRGRQAIGLAIDPKDYAKVVNGGLQEPIDSAFRHDSPFYDPTITQPFNDPVKAQQLIDQVAAANGGTFSFTLTAFPTRTNWCNQQFDKDVTDNEQTLSPQQRVADIKDAQRQFYSDVPTLYLERRYSWVFVSPNMQNFRYANDGLPLVGELWIKSHS
jgi:ABC-type transport system substrate-binding protein